MTPVEPETRQKKRKKKQSRPKSPTRIYDYKSRCPDDGAIEQLVRDQVRLAHKYKNQLVEIELERRRAVDATLAARWPEIAEVEAALRAVDEDLDRLDEEIRAASGRARSKVTTREQRRRRAELKATRTARGRPDRSRPGPMTPGASRARSARSRSRPGL